MKKILLIALALATGCVEEDTTPEPTTIGVGHCGVAPLDITWRFSLDEQATVVMMEPLEYAKVQEFRYRALAWMRCTIKESQ